MTLLTPFIRQLQTTAAQAHSLVEEDVWDLDPPDVNDLLRAVELLTVSLARGFEQIRTTTTEGGVTATRKIAGQSLADDLVRASHTAHRTRTRSL